MNDITVIDKNMKVETSIDREGLCFYDAEEAPFRIYGIYKEKDYFIRMPEEVALTVNEGVHRLHAQTAGGRVRFVTDSPYVAIKTEYDPVYKFSHFTLTGSSGFDMYGEYEGEVFYEGTFVPPLHVKDGYESVKDFAEQRERLVTINFPLYSNVNKLYIGLKEGYVLKEASDYALEKPIVFYGNSITQGCSASRPGCCYENILSRRFDFNYINLGFAGSAKGEEEMANYLKDLDMSVFVMDYDQNAPDPEHLEKTHSKMFWKIREAQPDLQILILSRPKYRLVGVEKERRDIVHRTYLEAIARGDRNVYTLDGPKLMALVKEDCNVDGSHPTDAGFFSMACAIGEVLEPILKDLK